MKLSLSVKASLCAFILLMAVFLNFIIPPFQYPDEPLHFGQILLFAGLNDVPEIEQDIIQCMDRFNWWKHVGMGTPERLPVRFNEIKIWNFKGFEVQFRGLTLFHRAAGGLLRIIDCRDTLASYYICRLLALFAVVGSWLIIFMVFMRLSRTLEGGLIAAPFFVLFLPQLHLLSLAANPDAANVLLGTAFFSIILRAKPTGRFHRLFLLLIPVAVLGLLTDESSFTLFALLFLFPIVFFFSGRGGKIWLQAAVTGGTAVFLIIWACWFFPQAYFDILRLVRHNIIRNLPGLWGFFILTPFHFRFFSLLIDSFLFQFGWMAFRASEVFYLIWKTLLALSFSGVILFLLRNRRKNREISAGNRFIHRLLLFFTAALGLQLIGLWMAQGTQGVLPQGRYFMPMIVPIAFIFCFGIKVFFQRIPKPSGTAILIALVLIEFFLLNFFIWNELIPAYYMRMLSPNPGI